MGNRTVELSLLRKCPVRCSYCPQEALVAASKESGVESLMAIDTVRQVIENARPTRLILAGFTEPTLHPAFMDIVRICAEAVPLTLFTTGAGLTEAMLPELSQRLALLRFHVTHKTSHRLLQLQPLIARHIPNAKWILVDDNVDPVRLKRLRTSLRPRFKLTVHPAISRASHLVSIDTGVRRSVPVTCPKADRERMPVIVPGGLALACCNDYSLELPLGNLAQLRWEELDWDRLHAIQRDPRSGAPCFRDCHWAREVR